MRMPVLCLMFLFVLLQGCSSAPPLPKKIVFSAHPDYPPLMWIKDDKMTGAAVEASKIIYSSLDLQAETKNYSDWKMVQEAAKNGNIDAISALYKNDERETYLLYSDPLIEDPVVAIVKKDKTFPFSRWDDLKNRKGLTPLGESFGYDFDTYMASELSVKRLSAEDALKALIKGDADYLVMGYYPAKTLAARLGIKNDIDYLPYPVTTQNMYLAISKKSPFVVLMPRINEKIKELRINGTILRLLDKYRIGEYKTINGIED